MILLFINGLHEFRSFYRAMLAIRTIRARVANSPTGKGGRAPGTRGLGPGDLKSRRACGKMAVNPRPGPVPGPRMLEEQPMEFHDLQKTRVNDLREMMKEHCPDVVGVVGMKKEEIVDILADKLGIEKPHKHVAAGLGKRAIKAEIRDLKVKRQAALEAGDGAELKKHRRQIHRRKRRLRRMMQLS